MYCSRTTFTVFLAACLTVGGLAVWSIDFRKTEIAGLPAASSEAPVDGIDGDRPMNVNGLLRWAR